MADIQSMILFLLTFTKVNLHPVNPQDSVEIHNLILAGDVQQQPRPLIKHVSLYRAIAQQLNLALEMLPAFGQACKIPRQLDTTNFERFG